MKKEQALLYHQSNSEAAINSAIRQSKILLARKNEFASQVLEVSTTNFEFLTLCLASSMVAVVIVLASFLLFAWAICVSLATYIACRKGLRSLFVKLNNAAE